MRGSSKISSDSLIKKIAYRMLTRGPGKNALLNVCFVARIGVVAGKYALVHKNTTMSLVIAQRTSENALE